MKRMLPYSSSSILSTFDCFVFTP